MKKVINLMLLFISILTSNAFAKDSLDNFKKIACKQELKSVENHIIELGKTLRLNEYVNISKGMMLTPEYKKIVSEMKTKLTDLRSKAQECPPEAEAPSPWSLTKQYCVDGKTVHEDKEKVPYEAKLSALFQAELRKRDFSDKFQCDLFFNKNSNCTVHFMPISVTENSLDYSKGVVSWNFEPDDKNFSQIAISVLPEDKTIKYNDLSIILQMSGMDSKKYDRYAYQTNEFVDFYSSKKAYNACKDLLAEKVFKDDEIAVNMSNRNSPKIIEHTNSPVSQDKIEGVEK